jgi:hypothetical protein
MSSLSSFWESSKYSPSEWMGSGGAKSGWDTSDPGKYGWKAPEGYSPSEGFKSKDSGFNAEKAGALMGTFANLFDKAKEKEDYNPSKYMGGFMLGSGIPSGAAMLGKDVFSTQAPSFSPMVLPGTPGSSGGGLGAKIGTLAGAALMAPFTGGMSLPAAMSAIGGAASLGGTAGSFFG